MIIWYVLIYLIHVEVLITVLRAGSISLFCLADLQSSTQPTTGQGGKRCVRSHAGRNPRSIDGIMHPLVSHICGNDLGEWYDKSAYIRKT